MVTEGGMAAIPTASVRHHFAGLIGPRCERPRHHEPLGVVGPALCAVVAGAEPWTAAEAYGHAKHHRLARHPLARHLSPDLLARRTPWGSAAATRRIILVDGKTVPRGGPRGRGLAPRRPVSAWAAANHLSPSNPHCRRTLKAGWAGSTSGRLCSREDSSFFCNGPPTG